MRRPRFPLIDDAAMLREPDQAYLIEGVCSVGALVLMHGQSGAGKSFLGADVAFSVASGRPWHERAVKQGPVIYIAAEGQAGFKDRIRAWKTAHGIEPGEIVGVQFIREPVDPLDGTSVRALREQLKALSPRPILTIVDTWSACLGVGGGNENETRDTSQAVAAWRRVMAEVGTAVWIIHHQGHNATDRARGNSALKAAAETEIAVSQDRGVILVENKKQRDSVPFDNIHFKLQAVALGDGRVSCVLVPAGASAANATASQLPIRALVAFNALVDATGEDRNCSVSSSVWRDVSGQSDRTIDRAIKDLHAAGYIEKSGERRGARYTVTEAGWAYRQRHLTATSSPMAAGTEAPSTAANRHTPVGGGGAGEGGDADG